MPEPREHAPLPHPERSLVEAALRYAARGWLVIPLHTPTVQGCTCRREHCTIPGKHPRTEHGLHDGSRALSQIRAWWQKWPGANVGIVTGKQSGLLVLDVDPAHGGAESLEALEAEYDRLPNTLTAHTGGGGSHFLFASPAGAAIHNKIGWREGLDIRAEGGFIVAPPSAHHSGKHYRWADVQQQPVPCPAWLVHLLLAPDVLPATEPRILLEKDATPGAYWLERTLQAAGAGNRNDQGFKLACQLRDDGLSLEEAEQIIHAYVTAVAHLGDHRYTEEEALRSLRSAFSRPRRERARRK